jgi:hypothetical protein
MKSTQFNIRMTREIPMPNDEWNFIDRPAIGYPGFVIS